MYEKLLQSITNKQAKIGIVGLGYVGLPLIRAFTNAGFNTIGYDVDEKKVEKLLKRAKATSRTFPNRWIKEWLSEKKFEATSDMSRLKEADAILICVPTPLNDSRDPDRHLHRKHRPLHRQVAAPRPVGRPRKHNVSRHDARRRCCRFLKESGLKPGNDFFVAYSPEREDPGNPNFTASGIPKVVGGLDKQSFELAHKLYGFAVVKTVPVSSCEVAEACKILENTYRAVNIAMVNELKILFDDGH